MAADLSYDAVGGTRVAARLWTERPTGYRSFERTVAVGKGEEAWERASEAVLRWGVKTRSGFTVATATGELHVRPGQDRDLVAHLGPVTLREPVRVIEVVSEPDRRGFSYGTRVGHPVSGEEAFVVHRSTDGTVWLTVRSLTRGAPGLRRAVLPFALLAQRIYRRRYAKALALG